MRFWKIAKDLRFRGFFFIFLACFCFDIQAREVIDQTGQKVIVPDQPLRIVTLAPSLGELVMDFLDDGLDRLVGVSDYSDYPPSLKRVPSIGPYHLFNLEKVFALKPDLVLATADGNGKDQVLHLRELGVCVVVLKTESFKDAQASMELIGKVLGKEARGVQMARQLQNGIQRFRETAKNRKGPPVRVMLQVGDNPLVVVGKKSFLHSALDTLGARNIYEEIEMHYPKPSLEDVLKKNPDVIVIIALGENIEVYQEMAKKWQRFPGLSAVQKRRVHVLKSDPLVRPTLRLLEGLSLLDRQLH